VKWTTKHRIMLRNSGVSQSIIIDERSKAARCASYHGGCKQRSEQTLGRVEHVEARRFRGRELGRWFVYAGARVDRGVCYAAGGTSVVVTSCLIARESTAPEPASASACRIAGKSVGAACTSARKNESDTHTDAARAGAC